MLHSRHDGEAKTGKFVCMELHIHLQVWIHLTLGQDR